MARTNKHPVDPASVVVSAVYAEGEQRTRVSGFTAITSTRPDGAPYIVVQVGSLLVYLYDTEAASDWRDAFAKVGRMIDEVFETNGRLDRPWQPPPKRRR